jgi:predicted Rossmann-fold nucleotide-binding protein
MNIEFEKCAFNPNDSLIEIQGFVVMPSGFGTLDELFEAITLIQTKKIAKFPIILVGTEFWSGLMD